MNAGGYYYSLFTGGYYYYYSLFKYLAPWWPFIPCMYFGYLVGQPVFAQCNGEWIASSARQLRQHEPRIDKLAIYKLAYALSPWNSRLIRRLTRICLLVTFVTFWIGLMIALGIRDPSASPLSAGHNLRLRLWLFGAWAMPFSVAAAAEFALDGQRPRDGFQYFIYRIASAALALGLPPILLYLLGRQDLLNSAGDAPVGAKVWNADQRLRL